MQYGKLCLSTMLEMQMLSTPHVRLLLALLQTVSHASNIMVRKSLTSFQLFSWCYCIVVELVCLSLPGASSPMIYTSFLQVQGHKWMFIYLQLWLLWLSVDQHLRVDSFVHIMCKRTIVKNQSLPWTLCGSPRNPPKLFKCIWIKPMTLYKLHWGMQSLKKCWTRVAAVSRGIMEQKVYLWQNLALWHHKKWAEHNTRRAI
jgi:hypothetical protein